jgi:thioredoxin-like negative regulator of GroEL
MYEISEDSFEAWRRDVLENPAELTLAYFTAPWCGPCRMLKPRLEELENENEGLTVVRIDVSLTPELARQFNIMSVPQLMFYAGGYQVALETGIKQKPFLQSIIDKYLGE